MIDNEIENRSKVIVRTSIVGIATNVVLSAFKAAIGFITGSIAVTLDAVNNLSDALSSVATALGIGCALLFGGKWAILDPIAAVLVSVFIIIEVLILVLFSAAEEEA